MRNPYTELYKNIQEIGRSCLPPDVQIGVVQTLSPLTVKVGGAVLTRGLYAPPAMLRAPPVPTPESASHAACGGCAGGSVSGSCPDGSITGRCSGGSVTGNCGMYWLPDLQALFAWLQEEAQAARIAVGDLVALKRVGETNVILCKVVRVD